MNRTRLIWTAAAWLIVSAALWLSDADPSVIALAGIVAIIAAVGLVAWDLSSTVERVDWPTPRRTDPIPVTDDDRVARTIRQTHAALRADSTHLHDTLVELVDDRLAVRHGIDRHQAPDAADRVLTPTLRRLLAEPHRNFTDPQRLRAALTDIEAL